MVTPLAGTGGSFACSLLRSLPGELCCVVVDELHMVADGDRGIGLEMSLSKLMFSPHAQHVQVIGMSATSERQEGRGAWLACVRVSE